MAELEQKLEEWKAYLKEAEYEEAGYVETMPVDELKDLLRRVSRGVKRRESAFSPNSPEYKSLSEQRSLIEQIQKILRDREMENSGLMLSVPEAEPETIPEPEVPEEERREQLFKDITDKQKLYEKARQNGDREAMQSIYKEVAVMAKQYPYCFNVLASFEYHGRGNKRRAVSLYKKGCELGSGVAAYNLALCYYNGILLKKDVVMAKKYLNLAVEREYTPAILFKAFELAGATKNDFRYKTDYEAAFSLFEKYYAGNPTFDMTNVVDRMALYYYYYSGAKSGHNMEKEALPVSWERLVEVEGICTDSAKELPGVMLEGQREYEKLIQSYIDAGTKEGMYQVKKFFFHDYFTSRPDLRQNLDNYLMKLRDAGDTAPEVKAELNDWYGRRHETGKDAVKDDAIAYAFYGKAGTLAKHREFQSRALQYLSKSEKITFFKNVINEGYNDVAKELAGLYEDKYRYDDAKAFYQLGAERAIDREVKKQCQDGYARCDEKISKRNAQIEEATPSYNQCNTETLGQKLSGFQTLIDLEKQGNTYAALRVAQLLEADEYLRDHLKIEINATLDEVIVGSYKMAAEAGEYEAIQRLVEIYEQGLLGQRENSYKAKMWRKRL